MEQAVPFGKYLLQKRLGSGGMAEIFLATERTAAGIERRLAVKRILASLVETPEFRWMFLDEARLSLRLCHPAIAQVYEIGTAEGCPYIAMEYVHGVTLSKLLQVAWPTGIPVEHSLRIISQVCGGLHYAHGLTDLDGNPLGIVHRDVSPENVLLSFDGSAKIIDFGVAKAVDRSLRTHANAVKGKFAYLSPEQCRGQDIDCRSDVFAVGILLHEALTGRPLYQRDLPYDSMQAIISEPVPDLRKLRPDLPPRLCGLVTRALQKAPDARFESAGEVQIEIERTLVELGLVSTPVLLGSYICEVMSLDDHAEGPQLTISLLGSSTADDSSAEPPTRVVFEADTSPGQTWGADEEQAPPETSNEANRDGSASRM